MFRPHWVFPVEGCLCFPVYTAQAPGCSIWSGPCVEWSSNFRVLHKSADSVAPVFCVFPGLSDPGSQRLGRPLPRVRCALSLRGPSACRRSGLRKSSDMNRGLFAGWEGVASLGLFAPCPSPCLLPPVGMGWFFSGVSQSLCFANRLRCVPAGQFFSCSPTV